MCRKFLIHLTFVPRQCSYQAPLQNIGFAFLADGNGIGTGNVTWRCCNCARDLKFGATTLSEKEYNKTACFQCKARPKEVIQQMRAQVGLNPNARGSPLGDNWAPPTTKQKIGLAILVIFTAALMTVYFTVIRGGSDSSSSSNTEGKGNGWGMMASASESTTASESDAN